MDFLEQMKLKYIMFVYYLGIICGVVGFIVLIPLFTLFFYPAELNQAKNFLLPGISLIILGFMMWRRTNQKSNYKLITFQDSGIIVVIAWIWVCLVSALPFILSGQLNFSQAIFESVSGWTTTGLSVVDVSQTKHIFLIWRSTMQFFGGAGIAVIMLASIIGSGGFGLYSAEGRTDLLLPNIKKSTKLIMTIYSGYILAGTVLYWAAGMSFFDSLNHAIAALSTGGFSTVPNSIGQYNSPIIESITIVLMLAGTINFGAHFILLKGNVKRFIKLGEIRLMLLLLSVMIPLVAFFSIQPLYKNLHQTIRISIFELVSALSTTGFSTVGYGNWNDFGIFVLILLMLIGGGTGSTAGGIKQYRIYVLLKAMIRNVKKFILPPKVISEMAVEKPEGTEFLSDQELGAINSFVFIYLMLYCIGVGILVGHGYPLKESMFEYASSLGTVGLSIGITAPTAPLLVLWAEIVGMLFGRLEILVIFYAVLKLVKDFKAIRRKRRRHP